MIGYKLFTPQWTAVKGKGGSRHPYQYEIGKSYEEPEKPCVGRTGFHFCQNLLDCFNHYGIDVHNRIGLIEAYGDIDVRHSDGAYATNKMKIIKEIPWREALEIAEQTVS